ncbi:MAG TPA: HD family phosphohydrolase [Gammaproteobacteria bacterium]|jgi:HD-GYP domain-containing protein (c-di-GMP phosphodiesterase class II)|nr:HD domain-containing phosphohydrolase [Gammaproteobacteria bacterium]MDP6732247.1 HD domain-containing phosphohydrolase [Gammaproteobacteria bacterium]HAJ75171.1 HD family phosphohydrolase [Gammaproteobacteria bacterium]
MNSLTNTQRTITIGYGPGYAGSNVWNDLKSKLIVPTEIVSSTAAQRYNPALILLDNHLLRGMEHAAWMAEFPDAIFLCTESMDLDVDLILSNNLSYRQTMKLLEMACYQWLVKSEKTDRAKLQDTSFRYLNKLADISISLSSEDDLMTLLRKILTEGQNIACCDAASLYLINEINDHERELVVKLTQNDSISIPFEEMHFPLDETSIAGFVAVTDSELNIPDAYQVSRDVAFKFNQSFDRKTGYRTKSVFAIPLTNKQQSVIGVLQFINRKKARSLKITDEKSAIAYTLPFDSDINVLLQALASQAGIAIENTILQNDIKALFEGFVNASVAAIEQRDPTTSGHSFRVADLCVELAQSVSVSNLIRLRNIRFTDTEVRELKYAALLHDFGKVGVREAVLVKEKKLTAGSLENIHYRIMLAQERLKSQALGQQLAMYRNGGLDEARFTEIDEQLQQDVQMLKEFYNAILEVNEPSVLKQDNRDMLDKINEYRLDIQDEELSIINRDEFDLLAIPKGSLSPTERKEIESHVVHTQNFLSHIPWTWELQNVTTIAAAHHEKLDGSGYPYGMKDEEIPLPSKIMAVCDIYDALTASDRPYKRAMNTDRAIDILMEESGRGLLDRNLVQVFADAKVFQAIDSKEYSTATEFSSFSNHPCDVDEHLHDEANLK